MNFPPRAGRVSGRATPSLRHAPRAKLQRTNPGSSPLSLRGILFRRSGPALLLSPDAIKASFFFSDLALCMFGAKEVDHHYGDDEYGGCVNDPHHRNTVGAVLIKRHISAEPGLSIRRC